MENKEMKLIVKIIGLVGAIFALIALFTPWGIGAYLFGADFGIFVGWDFFYINYMNSGASLGMWQPIFIGVLMIILFVLTLVTMILGLLTFKKIDARGPKAYLTPAILATVAFVLYIIGISIATGGMIGNLGYGIGFFMILITMILFYVSFALANVFKITATQPMYQQPMYQQPQYGQPQMMYTQQPPAQQMPLPQALPVQQSPTPQQQPQTPQTDQTLPPAETEKKFCQGCGTQLKPNAKFCASCGKQI